VEEYNKTKDAVLFLNSPKVAGMAERKIATLAKTALK
jgi:hypothetical protein